MKRLILAVIALAFGLSACYVIPSSIDATCGTDVSAQLNAYLAGLPDGAVVEAPTGACYQVDEGVTITHPLTLIGGTYQDNSAGTVGGGKHQGLAPIILVKDTHDVALDNLTVQGVHTTHGYAAPLVGQAGVKLESSDHISINNVHSINTFGDGLGVWAEGDTQSGQPLYVHTVRTGVTWENAADSSSVDNTNGTSTLEADSELEEAERWTS